MCNAGMGTSKKSIYSDNLPWNAALDYCTFYNQIERSQVLYGSVKGAQGFTLGLMPALTDMIPPSF